MPTTISGSTGVSQVQDGVVTPVKTQLGALPSLIRLAIANGLGSVSTCIRRFSTLLTSLGADITYSDSATLGASFTINANGVYTISYSDCFVTANAWMGISLNTSAPTTQINGLPVSEILAVTNTTGGNLAGFCSWTGYLDSGSVVRAHCQAGLAAGSGANPTFSIQRVA